MVGKFLLGMVSGGLLVAGGLVIGSAVLPPPAANDNAPSAEAAATPITAPAATEADAGTAVDAETADASPEAEEVEKAEPAAEPDPADADAAVADAADADKAGTAAEAEGVETAEPAAEPAPATADAATSEPLSDAPPAVADAAPDPAAPDPEVLAEAKAPAPTAVAAPEATPTPARPAETAADAAAALPDPALPAPPSAEETQLAEAGSTVEALPEAAPAETTEQTAPAVPEAAAAPTEGADQGAPEAQVAEAAPAADEPALSEAPPLPNPTDGGATAEGAEAEVAPPMVANLPAPADTEVATVDLPGTPADEMPGTPVPQPETAEAAEPDSGSTFKPAPRLIDAGEGVIVGRGEIEAMPEDAPEVLPAADPEAAPDAGADPNATPADARPITQFATTFENPDAKPPMAIVLIDRGASDLDRAGLAALPFPVSFALDPLDPATPAHAALYRAAGREVVMLVTGIAEGAQASDVEVAFQSMEQGLPEAVAVMDLADTVFQNDRQLASAVVPILKAQGRGLLTWDAGLNAADQVARREDLETAMVFRDLGTAGADKIAIRRLLDRAVFKAGQDGRVSVVGEADPDTVAALLEWSVEGKAATVALAPVTAVLTVE
ncbi:MAG: divergent polysaccharide deacetylase family protein [Tabrizicola sp.]|nr:divergent polysaccharide deacetylase family protein [Tabrizicola sp.]